MTGFTRLISKKATSLRHLPTERPLLFLWYYCRGLLPQLLLSRSAAGRTLERATAFRTILCCSGTAAMRAHIVMAATASGAGLTMIQSASITHRAGFIAGATASRASVPPTMTALTLTAATTSAAICLYHLSIRFTTLGRRAFSRRCCRGSIILRFRWV